MKKYFNNWRFFLKEGIGEEVIDVLTKIEDDKENKNLNLYEYRTGFF